MDFPLNSDQNQMDDEKSTIQSRKKYWEENCQAGLKNGPERQVEIVQNRKGSSSSEDEKVPEIKDIYDHIYGNVQSKLQFYEKKQGKIEPRNSSDSKNILVAENTRNDDQIIKTDTSTTLVSLDISNVENHSPEEPQVNTDAENVRTELLLGQNFPSNLVLVNSSPKEASENADLVNMLKISLNPSKTTSQTIDSEEVQKDVKSAELLGGEESPTTPTPVNSPIFEKKVLEKQLSTDLSKNGETCCSKCQKADFINDRSEVLTEINANLKLELESVKQNLKKEMAKNNELNFEIANIEAALEMYYKEAKNQKSTLSSIYSAMKSYVSDQKTDFQESYTYKRIKMIADYMESLKNKLEHQDRIIKNNFVENPYYTDLIIKHEAVLKQLDDMSKANQDLEDEIKRKAEEEQEIIKELNRQKFQVENRCKDLENYYRNEIITKEALIRSVEDEYQKQLEEFRIALDQKDEEMEKIQKTAAARINNYKQELVIVYRKWKEQKRLNSLDK